jgi:kumamolisin
MFFGRIWSTLPILAGGLIGATALAQAPAADRVAVHTVVAPNDAKPRPDADPKPGDTLHLVMPLASTKAAALEAYASSIHDPKSPNFGHFLTAAEIGQRFGASDADINAVVAYAQAQGFSVTHVWPNRFSVSMDTTVAQAEKAFGIHILGYARPAAYRFPDDKDTFFAPDKMPTMPRAIAGRVNSILGISNLVHGHPALSRKAIKPMPGAPASYQPFGPAPLAKLPQQSNLPILTPAITSKIYDVDGLHAMKITGTGVVTGIFSPTSVPVSDTATFAKQYGIDPNGYTINEIKIDGGEQDLGAVEADLDLQVTIGQAPNVTVNLYEPPYSEAGWVDGWNKILADGCPVVSCSWYLGYEDNTQAFTGDPMTSVVQALEPIFAALDASGASLFIASGDSGAYDGNTGAVAISYPESTPSMTNVGGTALINSNNGAWTPGGEVAWIWEDGNGGSGGGISQFPASVGNFTQPAWQAGPGVPNTGHRMIPDVAAMADPGNPGWAEYCTDYGGWVQIGGTSASSPLWAAVTRLMLQAAESQGFQPKVGFGLMNPAYYFIGTNLNPQNGQLFAFHDITSGDNGQYFCTPFWDLVTGWGSADFTKLYFDLVSGQVPGMPALLLPNIHPVTPSGKQPDGIWKTPIMVHKHAGNVAEGTVLATGVTYQIAGAIGNDGPADTMACTNTLQIDNQKPIKFGTGPIPGGGSSSNDAITTVKFTLGQHTLKLSANSDHTITTTSGTSTYTRTITVVAGPILNTLTTPAYVTSGTNFTANVTLSGVAPTGGANVVIKSLTSGVIVPATVNVPAGKTSASFTITAPSAAQTTMASISASYNGDIETASFTVEPQVSYKIILTPSSTTGGLPVRASVVLSAPAPAGGLTFQFASDNAAVTVPSPTIVVNAGSLATYVTLKTNTVTSTVTAHITANIGSEKVSSPLTIKP